MKLRLVTVWLLASLLAAGGAYCLLCLGERAQAAAHAEDVVGRALDAAVAQTLLTGHKRLEKVLDMAVASSVAPLLANPDAARGETLGRVHALAMPLAQQLNGRLGADFLWLVNTRGEVVARLPEKELYGDGVSGLPSVGGALNGAASEGILLVNKQVMQVAAAPVVETTKHAVVGGLVAGFELGKVWLDSLAQRTKGHYALFQGRKTFAATDPAIGQAMDAALAQVALTPDAAQALTVVRDGVVYAARASLLEGTIGGLEIGVAAFAPLPALYVPFADRRVQAVALGGLALFVLGLLTTLLVSASLRKQSARLAAQIEEMRRSGTQIAGTASLQLWRELEPLLHLAKNENGRIAPPKPDAPPVPELPKDKILTPKKVVPPSPRPGEAATAAGTPPPVGGGKTVTLTLEMMGDEDAAEPPGGSRVLTGGEETSPYAQTLAFPSLKQPAAAPKAENRADPIPDDEDAYFSQVFEQFLDMRRQCGQSAETVNRDKFLGKLKSTADGIRAKRACKKVQFTVFVQEGKAAVKGLPIV
ncbi:MAG: hypothetical protein C4523_20390 [Myxococcales bacterium]|nr:MAG: hypothetical protein C4523_20390 [Myxococcales bacterium]